MKKQNRSEFILIGKTKKDVDYYSIILMLALVLYTPLMIISYMIGGLI